VPQNEEARERHVVVGAPSPCHQFASSLINWRQDMLLDGAWPVPHGGFFNLQLEESQARAKHCFLFPLQGVQSVGKCECCLWQWGCLRASPLVHLRST
jgi:hypothetical protein